MEVHVIFSDVTTEQYKQEPGFVLAWRNHESHRFSYNWWFDPKLVLMEAGSDCLKVSVHLTVGTHYYYQLDYETLIDFWTPTIPSYEELFNHIAKLHDQELSLLYNDPVTHFVPPFLLPLDRPTTPAPKYTNKE